MSFQAATPGSTSRSGNSKLPAGLSARRRLAAAYAKAGRLKEAAGVMQKLIAEHDPQDPIEPFPLIILCEIYQQLGDWDEIIHLVAHFNITNIDDGTLVLRSYQAIAMANSNLTDAALEVFKDCLKSTKRNPGLLHTARYARAQLYKNTGKKSLARRDLSRVYAEDPETYAELAAEIAGARRASQLAQQGMTPTGPFKPLFG